MDRISCNHCLLLPQHCDISLGYDKTYLLFTTSTWITLDDLSHVGHKNPDQITHTIEEKDKDFFLNLEDSVFHHDKFKYCKFKDKIKLFKKKAHTKSSKKFQTEKSGVWSNQILHEKTSNKL